jgi:nucleoside-diphosphate-sugar epimerase
MQVLVTGDRGLIGGCVADGLSRAGHAVVGYDARDGHDVLDLQSLSAAAEGCGAIVHLAAIPHDTAGTPERIMSVNVLGTWHVLLAAQAVGAGIVVLCSSAQVLGVADGERAPDYLPIDDDHPRHAQRPYGLSKRLAEDLCDAFTARSGIATVALRPFAVWGRGIAEQVAAARLSDPSAEGSPFWEYGAFVDARDVAAAAKLALERLPAGHHRLLLCAEEISGSADSLELAARFLPGVEVRHPDRYRVRPRLALVDCCAARDVLGWRPRHGP